MKILFRLIGYLKLLYRLNIIQTVRFNFTMLNFSDAIKIPFYFFGPVKFVDLSGNIVIERSTLKRGMIEFGSADENIIATKEPMRLAILGSIEFKGSCKFSKAIQLYIANGASLSIGEKAWFGSFTKIVSFEDITIGKNFMGSWECQIFDTDFHFTQDVLSGSVAKNIRPVRIGDSVWLGSRVTVLKGTQVPDYTVVAVGSICNKSYLPLGSRIVIGGVPARLLRNDIEYVSDKQVEKKLNKFFKNDRHAFEVNLNNMIE